MLTFKDLAYNDNVVYLGTHNQIKMLSVEDNLANGEIKTLKVEENEVKTIDLRARLLGLYINKQGAGSQKYLFTVFETEDNQLDFNTLHLKEKPSNSSFDQKSSY